MKIGIIDSGKGGEWIANFLNTHFKPTTSIERFHPYKFESYADVSMERLFMLADMHMNFLEARGVDCIVIGCMTLSTNAREYIRSKASVPVFDLYSSLPCLSSNTTVIATANTLRSGRFAFARQIDGQNLSSIIEKHHETATHAYYVNCINKLIEDSPISTPSSTILVGCSHYFWVEAAIIEAFGTSSLIRPYINLVSEMNKYYV